MCYGLQIIDADENLLHGVEEKFTIFSGSALMSKINIYLADPTKEIPTSFEQNEDGFLSVICNRNALVIFSFLVKLYPFINYN